MGVLTQFSGQAKKINVLNVLLIIVETAAAESAAAAAAAAEPEVV